MGVSFIVNDNWKFVRKAIAGGFGGMTGGWFRCRTKEDNEMLNGSERILRNPLSLQGLRKCTSIPVGVCLVH